MSKTEIPKLMITLLTFLIAANSTIILINYKYIRIRHHIIALASTLVISCITCLLLIITSVVITYLILSSSQKFQEITYNMISLPSSIPDYIKIILIKIAIPNIYNNTELITYTIMTFNIYMWYYLPQFLNTSMKYKNTVNTMKQYNQSILSPIKLLLFIEGKKFKKRVIRLLLFLISDDCILYLTMTTKANDYKINKYLLNQDNEITKASIIQVAIYNIVMVAIYIIANIMVKHITTRNNKKLDNKINIQ